MRDRLFWPAWCGVAALVASLLLGAYGVAPLLTFTLGGVASGAALRQVVLATRRQGLRGLVGGANGGMIVHLGVILIAVSLGASNSFIKQLLTQGDRTRAIAYITNELSLDIEKEYEKYDIPVPVRSPEYKKIQDLKKDGQIELLRSYGASKYAIQRLDNEEKRIKLILSIQTQRENSLK